MYIYIYIYICIYICLYIGVQVKKQKPQFHSFINVLKKVLTKVFIYKCLKQK